MHLSELPNKCSGTFEKIFATSGDTKQARKLKSLQL